MKPLPWRFRRGNLFSGDYKMVKKKYNLSSSEYIFVIILLIFFIITTIIISLKLDQGIIPDEPTHFALVKQFSTTLTIPDDTLETYKRGVYIKDNPFLFYWIEARILNLINFAYPNLGVRNQLIALRISNVFFSILTVITIFSISCEVITRQWFRLLPIFILVNTMMFVVLSAGVNYDNLTNLLAAISILLLLRILKGENKINNTLLLIFMVCLGMLTKKTFAPLALILAVVWIINYIKKRDTWKNITISGFNRVMLFLLLFVVLLTTELYLGNIIQYHGLTPDCEEILSADQCANSPFVRRKETLGLPQKLTPNEAVQKGYPSIIRYIPSWIRLNALRIFGVLGHKNYFQPKLVTLILSLFFLAYIQCLFLRENININIIILSVILIFYSITLLITNYNFELTFGFIHVALQGRYLFPVLAGLLVVPSYFLSQSKFEIISYGISIAMIVVIFLAGPIKFLIDYQTIFNEWFL